ncbi:MAG: hypothetical protein ABFS21_11585 [Actinomycetota bacterium]
MRYDRSDSFKADYKRLSETERELFRRAVRVFNEAADRAVSGASNPWPAKLRVRGVQGADGVFEMTWSFSGPDGRATWEWVVITDPATGERHRAVRWRLIGGHAIFKKP